MKRKTIKYLLVSILTIAMVCSSNIAEAKSRRSSSRSSSSRSSSSSKSYSSSSSSTKSSSSSSSSTKTPTSTSSTNKNTANNKTNSSTTKNTNTSTSNTNTTNSVETNKNTTEIANKNSSLKVDSGTFTTKPDSITNNKSNSKNLNTSNNATSNNKTSSNNTSTSNYKYTVAPKQKTTNSSYTPSYYNNFDSNRYYSRNLGFFDYYMISHLINNNSNNRISERDIVYALEENGYTKDEIDNIMTDLEQEQKSKNNTNNTKKENALIESIPYIILGILIILILVSTLKR